MIYALFLSFKLKNYIMNTELFDPAQFGEPEKKAKQPSNRKHTGRSENKTSLTVTCTEEQRAKIKIAALLAKKTTSTYVLEILMKYIKP